jgi:hypothetical protein
MKCLHDEKWHSNFGKQLLMKLDVHLCDLGMPFLVFYSRELDKKTYENIQKNLEEQIIFRFIYNS